LKDKDMIKILVTDLDETLLHTDKSVSEDTLFALKKAREAGIKIVIATARPVRSIRPYLTRISCDAVICHNGAVILIDGEIIARRFSVPIGEAEHILHILAEKYPFKKLSVEIEDKIYANFDTAAVWGKTQTEYDILKNSTVKTDFTDLPKQDADKVLIELKNDDEHQEILDLLSPGLYTQLSDNRTLCQIMNINAKKIKAIQYLSDLWDVSVNDIAAFGDDYNDIEMLTGCGIGVAVNNANDEIKDAADAVTLSNNDDGVAHYIMNYLL
jgi:Cof subfamily protein (haloacid dehalogenase superfamily)